MSQSVAKPHLVWNEVETTLAVITEGTPTFPEVAIYEETAFGTTRIGVPKCRAREIALKLLQAASEPDYEEDSFLLSGSE